MMLPVVLGRETASSNGPAHVLRLRSTAGYISLHLLVCVLSLHAPHCVVNPSKLLTNSTRERRQIVNTVFSYT